MAIDFLEWCGRHADGLFVAFLVIAGLKFIGDVIVAIDTAVKTYRERKQVL